MECNMDCLNCGLKECIHDTEERQQYVDELFKKRQCEYFKEYYQENHENILKKDSIRHKKYYKKHKRRIDKKQKKYDEEHKEQRRKRAKERYEQNKEEINRKRRERYRQRKENSA